jgi:hypothetical protein
LARQIINPSLPVVQVPLNVTQLATLEWTGMILYGWI